MIGFLYLFVLVAAFWTVFFYWRPLAAKLTRVKTSKRRLQIAETFTDKADPLSLLPVFLVPASLYLGLFAFDVFDKSYIARQNAFWSIETLVVLVLCGAVIFVGAEHKRSDD